MDNYSTGNESANPSKPANLLPLQDDIFWKQSQKASVPKDR